MRKRMMKNAQSGTVVWTDRQTDKTSTESQTQEGKETGNERLQSVFVFQKRYSRC